jgi:hypothetical protein
MGLFKDLKEVAEISREMQEAKEKFGDRLKSMITKILWGDEDDEG